MGWITPITTWIPSPVGNADLNRIEGNINYLREETKTINGATTFTNNITQTAGVITSRANKDIVTTLGYGKLGFATGGTSGQFVIAQAGNFNSTDYGLLCAIGGTNINAKLGGFVRTRINNTDVVVVDGTAITMNKPLSVEASTNATATLKSKKNGAWSVDEVKGALNFYGSDVSGLGVGNHAWIKALATDTIGARTEMVFGVCESGGEASERYRIKGSGSHLFLDNTGSTLLSLSNTAITMNKPLEVTTGGIKTDNVYIKHKEFTGTLDASGDASFSHGIDGTKILQATALGQRLGLGGSWWQDSSYEIVVSPTNVSIRFNGTYYGGDDYRVLLTYEV